MTVAVWQEQRREGEDCDGGSRLPGGIEYVRYFAYLHTCDEC